MTWDMIVIVAVLCLLCFAAGWRCARVFGQVDAWIEATDHDVSVLPGGMVLHHSTCWCKR